MLDLSSLDWDKILVPAHPLEMLIRGTLTYLGLLVVLRIGLKRQEGNLASSDLLVTVLIADAIQNGMAGEYQSVPDGLLLVATLVGWDFIIDWLKFRSKWMARLFSSPPLPLVENHKLLRKNMRQELITEDELWSKLRQEGVEKLSDVKRAVLEPDGEISVIKVH